MLQFMNIQACSQDASASVGEMLEDARNISHAFAAVAEGGNRQAAKYKAILTA